MAGTRPLNNYKNSVSVYCTMKKDCSPSLTVPSLNKKKPRVKKSFKSLKIRISSHQLRIKTDRCKKIPRNDRICSFCNSYKIEDENHFLQDCKAYSHIRDVFFSKRKNQLKYLISLILLII